MRFLAPAAWFALALTLPILVLYMLRLRRRDVVVPSLLLWEAVLGDRYANRPWQKLRHNWLLFLQLLILLLLVLSLARPAVPAPVAVHGHIIVLLDVSASMQTHMEEMSRFDLALRELRQLAAGMNAGDRVALIAAGPSPQLLLQQGDAAAFRHALERVAVTDGPADWKAAAALAAGLASNDEVTTLLVTDAAIPATLPALPGTVQLVEVGSAVANVGIVSLALRRAEEGLMAFARLYNAGPETTRALTLYADGIPVARRTVSLPADAAVSLTFVDVPVRAWVQARLEQADALLVDNRAWVALSDAASGEVWLVTPGNRFLAQALSTLPDLAVTQSSTLVPPATVTQTTSSQALVIVDGPVTATLPLANLWLIAPGSGSPCGEPGGVITPTQGVRGQWSHALLQYVDWQDVHISRARHYDLPADAEVLLETVSGPLLWVFEHPTQRVVCMAFDLHDSDLPLHLAFPVLTANLVHWLLPHTSTAPITPLPAGQPWSPPLPPDTLEAVLFDEDGVSYTLDVESPQVFATQAGLYRLDIQTSLGQTSRYVALSLLDEAETDVRPRDVQVARQVVLSSLQASQGWRDISRIPLGLAVFLLVVEAIMWWRPLLARLSIKNGAVFRGIRNIFQFVAPMPLLLRAVLLLLVCLALVGLRASRRTRDLAVVFVLDRSASTQSAWEGQVSWLERALQYKAPRDRAALVVFGRDAWVDRALSTASELSAIATLPRRDATDIEQAVRLGLTLIPEGAPGRLVILTDGLETSGRALWALREARAQGIELLVAKFGQGEPGPEVWISDMRLPSRVYPGDRVPVSVEISANVPQNVRLIWTAAEQTGQETLSIVGATRTQLFSFQAPESGFLSLRACVEPVRDVFLQNNCADGWAWVASPPQVWVVGDPAERAALIQALRQAGLSVEARLPEELPLTASGFVDVAALVLVNTPARTLAPQTLAALHTFVRDLGGGLVAVGGPESYGVGGWLETPLEAMLPVDMRVQDPRRFPPLAMMVVIDKSGSMANAEAGIPKIRLAAEATIRVAETLNDTDVLAVIAYDDRPADTLGPVSMSQRASLVAQLQRLQAGGGGIYIQESVAYAAGLLREVDLPLEAQRHILLLADGSDAEHQQGTLALIETLRAEDVTVSAVAIGIGQDVNFLARVADLGEGRFYLAQRAADLPAIFAEEAARAKRSYVVETLFYPVPVSTWTPVLDISATPALRGYVATTPKTAAQVVWQATQGDPLLAIWQYGLGRSVAWTSDATGRWSADWISWDAFARFWGGVVRDVLPAPSDTGVTLRVLMEDDKAHVLVDVVNEDANYVNDLALAVHIAHPLSEADAWAIPLHQTAPGRYEGYFDLPQLQGALLLRLSGDRSFITGWSPPASLEYVPGDAAAAVARLVAQGDARTMTDPEKAFAHTLRGREVGQPLSPWLLVLALCLWPLDIAWRRLALTRADLAHFFTKLTAWWGERRSLEPPGTSDAAPTLAAQLRQKQQRTLEDKPTPPVEISHMDTVHISDKAEPAATAPLEEKGQPAETEDAESDSLAARLKRRLRD